MGFFGWIRDKVEDAIYYVKGRLGKSTYSYTSIESHIDVDKVLAEFRVKMEADASLVEARLMGEVSNLFVDLKVKAGVRFSDLVSLIDIEQKIAEQELQGTIMSYVKEHLSKNDESFLKVLEMQPGLEKENALSMKSAQVIYCAQNEFVQNVQKYAENICDEFTSRINVRIENQERLLEKHIAELKKLEQEIKEGNDAVDVLVDQNLPAKEAAECIVYTLEQEI